MKKIKIITLIIIILIVINHISPAQSMPVVDDSLIYYLEMAARNNPDVLQRYAEYQAAMQKIPQAGALPNPELSIGIFLSPMELVEGRQVADIRLMQMFPWFKTLRAAKDEMSLMALAKYELLRDAKLQVFFEVQRTWFELYKTDRAIDVSEKNRNILQTLERLTTTKFKTASAGNNTTSSMNTPAGSANQGISSGSQNMQGMGYNENKNSESSVNLPTSSMQSGAMSSQQGGSGLADLYRVQIEIGELENNIALLRNQRNVILTRFNSYLNRSVQTPVFPDTLKSDTLEVSLPSVSDSMLNNNPMLNMLRYEQESLDARRRMVTLMGYPMVGIGLNYSQINKNEMSDSPMNGKDMIMPMVTVTLPIYRKKYKAMQTESSLLAIAAGQNYESASNSLQIEYYQAIQLYQDGWRRMKLYSSQYMLADRTLEIMLKSFATSGSSLTDILRIQQQTLDFELKQYEATADYNTGIAWLKKLMAYHQTE